MSTRFNAKTTSAAASCPRLAPIIPKPHLAAAAAAAAAAADKKHKGLINVGAVSNIREICARALPTAHARHNFSGSFIEELRNKNGFRKKNRILYFLVAVEASSVIFC